MFISCSSNVPPAFSNSGSNRPQLITKVSGVFEPFLGPRFAAVGAGPGRGIPRHRLLPFRSGLAHGPAAVTLQRSTAGSLQPMELIGIADRFNAAQRFTDVVALYLKNNPKSRMFDGKGLILGGSHSPNYNLSGSLVGDLSAILIAVLACPLVLMPINAW